MPPSALSPPPDVEAGSPSDGEMVDLALSPMTAEDEHEDHHEIHRHQHDEDDVEHDAHDDGSDSRLIPLSMSDGGGSSSSSYGGARSGANGRPLPSLNKPFTFRDVQFIGIYVFQLLLMLLATGYIRADFEQDPDVKPSAIGGSEGSDSSEETTLEEKEMNASAIGTQLRSLCIVNVLFSFGWLLIYLFSVKMRFVQGSCAFSTIGLGILAFAFFAIENNSYAGFLGIVITATVVFDVLWIRKFKNGFDFVAVLFELIVDFLVKHPSLAYVTIGTLVLYTVWACWICTSLGYVGNGATPWQFSVLFLYLHFYWTSNIFKNILTVVVSGATIIWYYKDDSSDLSPQTISDNDSPSEGPAAGSSSIFPWRSTVDRKVILHYLRCALSTSFGSICIGSLLCPVAHVLWNLLRWARRDESVLSRRWTVLRSETAENFIRTYHKYSFVFVAGYGKPFYVAANESWKLIEKRGVEAIVDDDLTSRLLLLGGNGWASIMCALCIPAFAGTHHVVYFAVVSFVLSYTTLSIATQIMGAVIKTLFVCFAESPGRLSQLHPLIYHRFARLAEVESFRHHKAPGGHGF